MEYVPWRRCGGLTPAFLAYAIQDTPEFRGVGALEKGRLEPHASVRLAGLGLPSCPAGGKSGGGGR